MHAESHGNELPARFKCRKTIDEHLLQAKVFTAGYVGTKNNG